MKCILSTILLLIPLCLGITSDYAYEFGVDHGTVLYTKDGTILLLQQVTNVDIPLPKNYLVSYVKVTVRSISPPKVDYDDDIRRITIKYSWLQISQSSYSVLVKGYVA